MILIIYLLLYVFHCKRGYTICHSINYINSFNVDDWFAFSFVTSTLIFLTYPCTNINNAMKNDWIERRILRKQRIFRIAREGFKIYLSYASLINENITHICCTCQANYILTLTATNIEIAEKTIRICVLWPKPGFVQ